MCHCGIIRAVVCAGLERSGSKWYARCWSLKVLTDHEKHESGRSSTQKSVPSERGGGVLFVEEAAADDWGDPEAESGEEESNAA